MRTVSLLLLLCASLFAQDGAVHPGMKTLQVSNFTQLEEKLAAAVQQKDESALTALSTKDFELRMAASPDVPMPGDEWIANVLPRYRLRDFKISDMAVHNYNDNTAVISMNFWQDANVAGVKSTGDYFIVDVWRNSDTGWKLAARYVSPLPKKSTTPSPAPPRKQ